MLNKANIYLKDEEKITSLVCTFNQGQAEIKNKEEMIENFTRILEKNEYPHLVIFGLQECFLDVIPNLMENKYNRIDTSSLSQNFFDTEIGFLKKKLGLGYMYLHIFVKKMEKTEDSKVLTIESMKASTDSCGNMFEKKGSIVIPIKISYGTNNTIINFVNVHLPSNPKKVTERNICLKRSTEKLINTTFVFGDMNYRTSAIHEVPQLEQNKVEGESKNCGCETNNEYISKLKEQDQLLKELQSDNYIKQFKEASINFCPSCRFKEYNDLKLTKENTNRCQMISSKSVTSSKNSLYDNKRYPSWCDRILYKIKEVKNFKIEIDENSYNSEHVTMMSDHALVSLKFSIQVTLTQSILSTNDDNPHLIKSYYDKYLKYKQKYLLLKKGHI
jgi:hypothetical protein